MRKFDGDKLVIASHNKGKIPEIAALLAPFGVSVTSAIDHNVSEPEETEDSFKGNALLKARHTAKATGLPALADDSGLSVNALDGAPGIYSARWAEGKGGRDFDRAMKRVVDEIKDSNDQGARFICALALVWPDGEEVVFEGKVEGTITWPMRGENGFGYDAIFQPLGHDISFAQMQSSQKQAMSHRADAFKQLIEACF